MRLDINLASRPYEDARQFWMRWGTAVGTLGALTLFLFVLDVTGWMNARRDHKTISNLSSMIGDRDKVRADAERTLSLPENRTTRDKSQFLNQLIERKAFSWTQVLESLENVMPAGVHVVSISPQLDDNNELVLKMTVAGTSREHAVELMQKMENARRFANVGIQHITRIESQTGDTEQAELAAVYIPEAPIELAPDSSTEKPKTSKPSTSAKPKPSAQKGAQR